MSRYVAIILVLLMICHLILSAPSPLRLTIDCRSDEDSSTYFQGRSSELFNSNTRFDVESFCSQLQKAIPKAVKDGKFILPEPDMDQTGYSDTQVPMAVAPPRGFIPKLAVSKLKSPKLRIPKIKVPKLTQSKHGPMRPPVIGKPMSFPSFRGTEEESSAERMERLKKGVQKLLHFVKVLGQIDQYISERTRIVVDKLSKTFAE